MSTASTELNKMDVFEYDDDLSEDTILSTPLEIYPSSLGELAGGDEDEEIDPDSVCEGEEETYTSLIAHTRVRASIKRPVRLVKYAGAPVCLLVLEVELIDSSLSRRMPSLLRFKSIQITAEFKDAEGKPKLGPQVVMYCPEKYAGEPTTVQHSYSNTLKASLASSTAIPVGVDVGAERSHSRQFSKSSSIEIKGRAPRMGSRNPIVQWDVEEDEVSRRGVPNQLRLVVAVKNPEERSFNIKLNFTACLGFNLVEFQVKKKESVLSTRVDPKLLREQSLKDQFGQQHGQLWVCKIEDSDLAELTHEELRLKFSDLSNLKGSTVGAVSSVG